MVALGEVSLEISNLRLCSGDSTAHLRMDEINAEYLHAYYDLLKRFYNEHRFDRHPAITWMRPVSLWSHDLLRS